MNKTRLTIVANYLQGELAPMNKGMDERLDQAVVLLNQGRLQEGKDGLERLDAENPMQAPILYNLGMCYTELDFPDKAIAALEKCVSIQPEFANAWVALGVARAKKGDQAEAKQALEKALAIDADNPRLRGSDERNSRRDRS